MAARCKLIPLVAGYSTTAAIARLQGRRRMTARSILVTGGAGFIGSNIVAGLVEDGWSVTVADRLGEAALGNGATLPSTPSTIDRARADLRLAGGRGAGVAAIVHMGAISSTIEPDADLILQTNLGLSRDLWAWAAAEAAADLRLLGGDLRRRGGRLSDADDEASLKALRPLNPYGWSKALFDLFAVRSAASDDGAPSQWVGLKFFNVYGPNEAA